MAGLGQQGLLTGRSTPLHQSQPHSSLPVVQEGWSARAVYGGCFVAQPMTEKQPSQEHNNGCGNQSCEESVALAVLPSGTMTTFSASPGCATTLNACRASFKPKRCVMIVSARMRPACNKSSA